MATMFPSAEAYERFMGRWSIHLARRYLDFVRLGESSRVLDVGCGTGAMADAIASAKIPVSIVGIDPVDAFVDYCRARFTDPGYSFDGGNALELAYPNGSFDAAVSLLVLHLVPDPRKAAGEMRRVFPDRQIVDLEPPHPIYTSFYNITAYPQTPGLGSFFAGRTWEKGGFVARLRAILDDRGRPMVLANWNTDMGDGVEWSNAEEYPGYLKYTADAYRMFINEIIYSLTH